MSMDHSMKTGLNVADEVIKELRKVAKMHKKAPQHAILAVLKSPDIPSILVETAFLSNSKEEKKLRTRKFQNNIAKALRDGIIEIIKKGII